MCLAMAAKLPYLRVYVDNYINITPPQGLDREKSYERAKEEAVRLRTELDRSGVSLPSSGK